MCYGSGNCSEYIEPLTSHALGGLAGSRWMLLYMHVAAAILKVWHHVEIRLSQSMRIYV